jgi:hypothetical protein
MTLSRRHDEETAIDDTLDSIMNPRKLRPLQLDRNAPDPPMGSPLFKQQQKVMKQLSRQRPNEPEPVPQSERGRDDDDDDDDQEGESGDESGDEGESGEEDEGESGEEDDEEDQAPQQTRLERQLQDAIRKAKLLARITQLAKRGIRPTKTPNWRASEEELTIEVARMEVIAARSVRIEQGRAALVMAVGTSETGMNFVDDRFLPEDSSFKIGMRGYTKHLTGELSNYDDVLERGMNSVMGPPGEGYWLAELGFMLGSSMVMYRINKSKEDNAKQERRETIEQLKQNPEFRRAIAKEIVEEMRQQQLQERQTHPQTQSQPQTQMGPAPVAPAPQPAAAPAHAPAPYRMKPVAPANRMKPAAPAASAPASAPAPATQAQTTGTVMVRESIPVPPEHVAAMEREFGLKPSASTTSAPATATASKSKTKQGEIELVLDESA